MFAKPNIRGLYISQAQEIINDAKKIDSKSLVFDYKTEIKLKGEDLTKLINENKDFFNNLENLTIDNCGLDKLPIEIVSLVNLKELYLSNNELKKLPQDFSNMQGLKYLKLKNNNIEVFPPELFNTNLININLSKNNIKELPENFNNLPNTLSFLNLSENNISNLADIPIFKKDLIIYLHNNPVKITNPENIKDFHIDTIDCSDLNFEHLNTFLKNDNVIRWCRKIILNSSLTVENLEMLVEDNKTFFDKIRSIDLGNRKQQTISNKILDLPELFELISNGLNLKDTSSDIDSIDMDKINISRIKNRRLGPPENTRKITTLPADKKMAGIKEESNNQAISIDREERKKRKLSSSGTTLSNNKIDSVQQDASLLQYKKKCTKNISNSNCFDNKDTTPSLKTRRMGFSNQGDRLYLNDDKNKRPLSSTSISSDDEIDSVWSKESSALHKKKRHTKVERLSPSSSSSNNSLNNWTPRTDQKRRNYHAFYYKTDSKLNNDEIDKFGF